VLLHLASHDIVTDKFSGKEAAEAENVMSVLMGDDVESRKAFIQKNARDVRNLDF
jgi:DNA gyrase subunit B